MFIPGQQCTQSARPSHEVWQQLRGLFFPSPCLCVFVFAYLFCHHHHLHVVVGTKAKMWRLVTIKKVGALPTPLSFPFVLPIRGLFVSFVVAIAMFVLCCRNKGEGFMLTIIRRASGACQESVTSPSSFFASLVYLSKCLFACLSTSPLFYNPKGPNFPAFFLQCQ